MSKKLNPITGLPYVETINPITGLPFVTPPKNRDYVGRLTGVSVGTGSNSEFESYGIDPLAFYNKEEVRAQRQSLAEKWGNGAAKAGITLVGAIGENTVGTALGIGDWVFSGFDSFSESMANNPIGLLADEANKWAQEELPNYYTQEELAQKGTLGELGSANFWADKFLNGAAYSLGSIASMYLTKGAGVLGTTARATGLSAKMSRGLAAYNVSKAVKAGKTIRQALPAAKATAARVGTEAARLEAGFTMSMAEAAVEARETKNSVKETLLEEAKKRKAALTGEMNWENVSLDDRELDQIELQAGEAEGAAFYANIAVLAPTNSIMFNKMIAPFRTSTNFNRVVRDATKDVRTYVEFAKTLPQGIRQAAIAGRVALPFVENAVAEGFQEGMQYAISQGVSDYELRKFKSSGAGELVESLMETGRLSAMFDASGDILNKAKASFEDPEARSQMLVGAMVGLITGGLGAVRENIQRSKNTKTVLDALNDAAFYRLGAKAENINAGVETIRRMVAAEEAGDMVTYNILQNELITTQVLTHIKLGSMDLFKQQMEDAKAMSDEQFKEEFGIDPEVKFTDTFNKTTIVDRILNSSKAIEKGKDIVDNIFQSSATAGAARLFMSKEDKLAEEERLQDEAIYKNALIHTYANLEYIDDAINNGLSALGEIAPSSGLAMNYAGGNRNRSAAQRFKRKTFGEVVVDEEGKETIIVPTDERFDKIIENITKAGENLNPLAKAEYDKKASEVLEFIGKRNTAALALDNLLRSPQERDLFVSRTKAKIEAEKIKLNDAKIDEIINSTTGVKDLVEKSKSVQGLAISPTALQKLRDEHLKRKAEKAKAINRFKAMRKSEVEALTELTPIEEEARTQHLKTRENEDPEVSSSDVAQTALDQLAGTGNNANNSPSPSSSPTPTTPTSDDSNITMLTRSKGIGEFILNSAGRVLVNDNGTPINSRIDSERTLNGVPIINGRNVLQLETVTVGTVVELEAIEDDYWKRAKSDLENIGKEIEKMPVYIKIDGLYVGVLTAGNNIGRVAAVEEYLNAKAEGRPASPVTTVITKKLANNQMNTVVVSNTAESRPWFSNPYEVFGNVPVGVVRYNTDSPNLRVLQVENMHGYENEVEQIQTIAQRTNLDNLAFGQVVFFFKNPNGEWVASVGHTSNLDSEDVNTAVNLLTVLGDPNKGRDAYDDLLKLVGLNTLPVEKRGQGPGVLYVSDNFVNEDRLIEFTAPGAYQGDQHTVVSIQSKYLKQLVDAYKQGRNIGDELVKIFKADKTLYGNLLKENYVNEEGKYQERGVGYNVFKNTKGEDVKFVNSIADHLINTILPNKKRQVEIVELRNDPNYFRNISRQIVKGADVLGHKGVIATDVQKNGNNFVVDIGLELSKDAVEVGGQKPAVRVTPIVPSQPAPPAQPAQPVSGPPVGPPVGPPMGPPPGARVIDSLADLLGGSQPTPTAPEPGATNLEDLLPEQPVNTEETDTADPGDLADAPFRLGERSSQTLSETEAKKWLQDRGIPVEFYDSAIQVGTKVAHGYMKNALVYLWRNGQVGTEYHEAFHFVFRTLLNDTQREQLYKEAKKRYNLSKATNLELEEAMAEEFRDYVFTAQETGKGLTGKIKKFFQDIWNYIKAIFVNPVGVEQLFSMIESNKIPKKYERTFTPFKNETTAYSLVTTNLTKDPKAYKAVLASLSHHFINEMQKAEDEDLNLQETEETTEGLTDVTGKNADIERRQELANLITSKLELGIELPKILETLAEQGYVEKINNSAFFKQTAGRDAVVFNIDGAIVPMYRSSKGTSSKTQGKWYPFFFNAGDWLVKGGADSYKDGYNNPIIKQILDALNTNYTYDTPIATVEGDNNQILSLLGLEDLDVSSENNDGIFDYRNYGAIALVLEDWQSKLGNIDVTGYQKYLDGVSSNLIDANPTLKSEIQSAFDGISNLFAELAALEGAAQPTQEPGLPGPETTINIYAGTGENAELSNFAVRPFVFKVGGLDENEWVSQGKFNTVEGAFQAQKIEYASDATEEEEAFNLNLLARLRNASGAEAKSIGRQIKGLYVKDWNSDSSSLMKKILLQSFEQNPDALAKLLATGNATLTHTQDKSKWGTEFPKLLMEVRDELRGIQSAVQPVGKVKPGVEELFESNPELANSVYEALGFGKESNNIEILTSNYTRQSVQNDVDSLYLFTDNAQRTSRPFAKEENVDKNSWYYKKYKSQTDKPIHFGSTSNPTSAVIRGLNNAYPISTMSAYGTNWTDSNFELFKQTIDDEIAQIKQDLSKFSKVKIGDFRIGQGGRFAKLPQQHQQYLDNKLLEIGIDNTGNKPKIINSQITSQQKQQAQRLYSQYLDSIFPDSKVKDIVYHGSGVNIISREGWKTGKETGTGHRGVLGYYFSKYLLDAKIYAQRAGSPKATPESLLQQGYIVPAIVNAQNKTTETEVYDRFAEIRRWDENYAGFDTVTYGQGLDENKEVVVKSKEQIHILGNNQDIERFRAFVKQSTTEAKQPSKKTPKELRKARINRATELLGTKENDKGALAEYFYSLAFSTNAGEAISKEQLATIVSFGKDWEAIKDYLDGNGLKVGSPNKGSNIPAGLGGLSESRRLGNARILYEIYHNWFDVVDERLGNVDTAGWRSGVIDDLKKYGYDLKQKVRTIEVNIEMPEEEGVEVNEDEVLHEKIYNITHFEQSPAYRVSLDVRRMFGKMVKPTPNFLGMHTFIDIDTAYKAAVHAAVGLKTFEEMKYAIEEAAKNHPELEAVANYLNTSITPAEAAKLRVVLGLDYTNHKFFEESYDDETGTTVRLIGSDRKTGTTSYMSLWRTEAVQIVTDRPAALFKSEDGKLTINNNVLEGKTRLEHIQNAVKEYYNASELDLETKGKHLSDILWFMSMSFANNRNVNTSRVTSYLTNNPKDVRAFEANVVNLLKEAFNVTMSAGRVTKVELKNSPVNFFNNESSTVKNIAQRAAKFTLPTAMAFVSGRGKTIYPYNTGSHYSYIMNDLKRGKNSEIYQLFSLDESISNPEVKSIIFNLIENGEVDLDSFSLDTLKDEQENNNSEYKELKERESMIVRLGAFLSGDGMFANYAIPTQETRGRMDFVKLPVFDNLNSMKSFGLQSKGRKKLIGRIIMRDLIRINSDPALKNSKINNGFHLSGMEDAVLSDGLSLSETVMDALNIGGEEYNEFFKKIAEMAENYLETTHKKQVEEFTTRFNELGIENAEGKSRLDTEARAKFQSTEAMIDSYVFNSRIAKIEISMLLRGSAVISKDLTDFYKRMGLVNTPGDRLMIQGEISSDPEYGFLKEVIQAVISDVPLTDNAHDKIADNYEKFLSPRIGEEKAKQIADAYRKNSTADRTDGAAFISPTMFKAIRQGEGKWPPENDVWYNEYLKGGEWKAKYTPNEKFYYENQVVIDGVVRTEMDKNSYVVLTREFVEGNTFLQDMYDRMMGIGAYVGMGEVHLINTESAKKGYKGDVLNIKESMDSPVRFTDLKTSVQPGNKFLRPQRIDDKGKTTTKLNRQVRKNMLAAVKDDGKYSFNGKSISGKQLKDIFHNSLGKVMESRINSTLEEIGYTQMVESPNNPEARINFLKNLREIIIENAELNGGVDNNTMEQLKIVEGDIIDFSLPLAFPAFQSKYQSLILSLFKNNVLNIEVPGKELVMVPSPGKFKIPGESKARELRFTDIDPKTGTVKAAEVMVSADMLKKLGLKVGEVGLAYRIPHQFYSSTVAIKVVGVLPDSYSKTIVVPGNFVVQTGADFDIDKLFVVFKTTEETATSEATNNMIEALKSIALSPEHFSDTITPLTQDTLNELAAREELFTPALFEFDHPLTELRIESNYKSAAKLVGIYANGLAGLSVAVHAKGNGVEDNNGLDIHPSKSVIFTKNGEEFVLNKIQTYLKTDPTQLTAYGLNESLSAGLDAGKKLIHLSLNDNEHTANARIFLRSIGMDDESIVYFLNQPLVKKFVFEKDRRGKTYSTFQLLKKDFGVNSQVIRAIRDNKETFTINVNFDTLRTVINENDSTSPEAKQLFIGFVKALYAGDQLSTIYKVITPDTVDGLNDLSLLEEYLDNLDAIKRNNANSLVSFEQVNNLLNGEDYALTKHFYNAIRKSLEVNSEVFLGGTPAVKQFKSILKTAIGKTKFSAVEHRFIDRMLFYHALTKSGSPLSAFLQKSDVKNLLTDPNNNLYTKVKDLMGRIPTLQTNTFLGKIKEGRRFEDPLNRVFTIEIDNTDKMTTQMKDEMQLGFYQLMFTPEMYTTDAALQTEIKKLGKALVTNALVTTGLSPTYGSYFSSIPVQVFLTPITSKYVSEQISIGDYFRREFSEIKNNPEYFNDFLFDFIRNFGAISIKGSPLLGSIEKKSFTSVNNGQSFAPNNRKIASSPQTMFKSFTDYGRSVDKTRIYQWDGTQYVELQQLGINGNIIELNLRDGDTISRDTIWNAGSPKPVTFVNKKGKAKVTNISARQGLTKAPDTALQNMLTLISDSRNDNSQSISC